VRKVFSAQTSRLSPFYLYQGWAYKTVADSDALVVEILRNAGAILYVKTQTPQTLLVSIVVDVLVHLLTWLFSHSKRITTCSARLLIRLIEI
jgi:hypothetical protein